MEETEHPCPDCGDEHLPIDPRFGICWACLPCYCGQGCGFSHAYGDMGYKTCELGIDVQILDARLLEKWVFSLKPVAF